MKWISVNDRLPKEKEKVLIWVSPDGENPFATAGYFYNDGIQNCWWEMNTQIEDDWIAYEREVDYWMPLPEGPKDENK